MSSKTEEEGKKSNEYVADVLAMELMLDAKLGWKFDASHEDDVECKICYESLKGEYSCVPPCGCVMHWKCVRTTIKETKTGEKCGGCGKPY